MGEQVKVYNKAIDATAMVPRGALEHYAERGWVQVDPAEEVKHLTSRSQPKKSYKIVEVPSESSSKKKRKKGSKSLKVDDDALDSDEASSQDLSEENN